MEADIDVYKLVGLANGVLDREATLLNESMHTCIVAYGLYSYLVVSYEQIANDNELRR
jgi:hypothetical protein